MIELRRSGMGFYYNCVLPLLKNHDIEKRYMFYLQILMYIDTNVRESREIYTTGLLMDPVKYHWGIDNLKYFFKNAYVGLPHTFKNSPNMISDLSTNENVKFQHLCEMCILQAYLLNEVNGLDNDEIIKNEVQQILKENRTLKAPEWVHTW